LPFFTGAKKGSKIEKKRRNLGGGQGLCFEAAIYARGKARGSRARGLERGAFATFSGEKAGVEGSLGKENSNEKTWAQYFGKAGKSRVYAPTKNPKAPPDLKSPPLRGATVTT